MCVGHRIEGQDQRSRLGFQFKTWSVGHRSSVEDSFLVSTATLNNTDFLAHIASTASSARCGLQQEWVTMMKTVSDNTLRAVIKLTARNVLSETVFIMVTHSCCSPYLESCRLKCGLKNLYYSTLQYVAVFGRHLLVAYVGGLKMQDHRNYGT